MPHQPSRREDAVLAGGVQRPSWFDPFTLPSAHVAAAPPLGPAYRNPPRPARPPAPAEPPGPSNRTLIVGASLLTVLILTVLIGATLAVIHSPGTPPPANPALTVQADPVRAEVRADEFAGAGPAAAEEPPPPAAPEPVAVVPPQPPARPPDRSPSPPACQTYGTSVQFLGSPAEAARAAAKENKLQFVLHISGNFEDSRFT